MPITLPLLPSAPTNLVVPRMCLVEYGATCIHRTKWLTLSRPNLSPLLLGWGILLAFFFICSVGSGPLLSLPFPETLACPSSRFISPHSLGDTILSTESAVAAAASLSPWLTPAFPVLVPVRDFEFKLNFNVAALMFEVELPSQEVAEGGESIVMYLSISGTPGKMSLENTLSLQGIEQQHSDTGIYFVFWLE